MTDIPVKPFILSDVDLVIEEDNYEAHVSTVRFDPSTNIVRWRGMTPKSKFAAQTDPDWAMAVAYAQDWETPKSFSRYLQEHQGQVKTVKFKPKKPVAGVGGTAVVTADIIIAPGPIGGDVDGVATGSVTMGVNGQPVLGVS